jgi:hypothetical protein
MSQLDYGNPLRQKEKQERHQPEPYGYAAVRGDAGNDVQVKDGNNEKSDEVPAAKRSFQMNRSWKRGFLDGQKLLPLGRKNSRLFGGIEIPPFRS